MKTETLKIGGMTCINCQNRIEKKLNAAAGIENAAVSFSKGTAAVTYDDEKLSLKEIITLIESLDYKVINGGQKDPAMQPIGYLLIIIALYVILRQFTGSPLSTAFPLASAGMSYGMIFVIGLITSVHCIAMCGGINLSQCLQTSLIPPILYNGGRVISYTVTGVIVGALGQVISVTGAMQGVVQIAAGVFMVIMGINMLGIFPGLRRITPRLPRILQKKVDASEHQSKSPFVVGLLNGLMPCGPLQAMQLYALSTGSPIAGGVSMFLFSIGTVPLMFGIGALSSLLSKKFTAHVMKAGAIMVAVLGLTMFTNGYSLSGLPSVSNTVTNNNNNSVVENGVQIVNSTLNGGRYPAITVRQGIPVKWTINAPQGSINGCNNSMIIREYGIKHTFKTGENIIEFTPERTGKFSYSCWMGMIRSSITVLAQGEELTPAVDETSPKPAGVQIPAETVALGAMAEGIQTVTLNLTDNGFEPAIAVLQKNTRTKWIINNNSLDAGNSALVFPIYYTQLNIDNGENVIGLVPTDDFEFSTIDNIYYGFVKVVDDIQKVDTKTIETIKNEAAAHETLIYPDSYFEQGSGGGGCCR
ncbi:heavy metal-associated domain-containing protein [Spirochaetia bacterium]|nr:heavy metal-associated domain-containing protein [Spirochaetia bacterium]